MLAKCGRRWNKPRSPDVRPHGGCAMGQVKLYRRSATECLALADYMSDPGDRALLVAMAARWHDLAERTGKDEVLEHPSKRHARFRIVSGTFASGVELESVTARLPSPRHARGTRTSPKCPLPCKSGVTLISIQGAAVRLDVSGGPRQGEGDGSPIEAKFKSLACGLTSSRNASRRSSNPDFRLPIAPA